MLATLRYDRYETRAIVAPDVATLRGEGLDWDTAHRTVPDMVSSDESRTSTAYAVPALATLRRSVRGSEATTLPGDSAVPTMATLPPQGI